MHNNRRRLQQALALLIVLGTLAGLMAAVRRVHAEHNYVVEIALEWEEVSRLAQVSQQPLDAVLAQFKAQGVRTLVVPEETLGGLEQSGAAWPQRFYLPGGKPATRVVLASPVLLPRVQAALKARGLQAVSGSASAPGTFPGGTTFTALQNSATRQDAALPVQENALSVPVDYVNLRSLGLGLSPEAVEAAQRAGLRIAGRLANFPGVSEASAENVLNNLRAQGAELVIFIGDEVLGYRGLEKSVAAMLRDPAAPDAPVREGEPPLPPATGLTYGAVEFGKQKGDETLSSALRGDYVRVHSIQTAEMATLSPEEIIDRFVKAARERNIRFCYVRLLTLAGNDPVGDNVEFLKKIALGMEHGSVWTGGDLSFGSAKRYAEPGVSKLLFALIALGVAAGTVGMVGAFCPLPGRLDALLLVALSLVCVVLAVAGGEFGRKLVALLAGIAFPAWACLKTFPRKGPRPPDPLLPGTGEGGESGQKPLPRPFVGEGGVGEGEGLHRGACVRAAVCGIALASAITALGIIHVIGLLASRSFMLRADQFLGIKAQHAIPLLIVAVAALAGGVALPDETWRRYRARATENLRAALDEPARYGALILGLAALAALALIVARTGNDAGVGVSGFELKARAVLDRVLPVRPRTKEFLVGHPAFLLGLAWWWRGRRRLAIPCFVVGSLGQVSLLNTFCHIHTPLVISLWRGALGLIIGTLLGILLFYLLELLLPPPIPAHRFRRVSGATETAVDGEL
jgi:hypothetical protein